METKFDEKEVSGVINPTNLQLFLLEFNTEEEALKAISSEPYFVKVSSYNDRHHFCYSQIDSPKFHPIVDECRGIILSKDFTKVLSRPFDRFYNYGEGEHIYGKDYDLNIWDIEEKVDGTMIQLYHDGRMWCFGTKGTAFSEGPLVKVEEDKLFCDLAFSLVKDYKPTDGIDNTISKIVYKNGNKEAGTISTKGHYINLSNLDKLLSTFKDYTFIMELVGPENKVIVDYKESQFILIAVRNNKSGFYVDLDPVDLESFLNIFTNARAINRFHVKEFNNINRTASEVSKIIYDINKDRDELLEGVVAKTFYCGDIRRVKIKTSLYLKIAYLVNNFDKEDIFLDLVLDNEQDEFLIYFPEYKDKIVYWENILGHYFNQVNGTYDEFKNIEDQKEFALKVKDYFYKSLLFKMRSESQSAIISFNSYNYNFKVDQLKKFEKVINNLNNNKLSEDKDLSLYKSIYYI